VSVVFDADFDKIMITQSIDVFATGDCEQSETGLSAPWCVRVAGQSSSSLSVTKLMDVPLQTSRSKTNSDSHKPIRTHKWSFCANSY
jgi:hypothetical protein